MLTSIVSHNMEFCDYIFVQCMTQALVAILVNF